MNDIAVLEISSSKLAWHEKKKIGCALGWLLDGPLIENSWEIISYAPISVMGENECYDSLNWKLNLRCQIKKEPIWSWGPHGWRSSFDA